MSVPERTRLVRIALDGDASAAEGALLVRGDDAPVRARRRLGGRRRAGGLGAAGRGGRRRRPVRAARPAAAGGRCRRRARRRRRLVRLSRLQPRRAASSALPPPPPRPRAAARLRARLLRPRAAARRRGPLVVRGALDGRAGRRAARSASSSCGAPRRRACASGRCGSAASSPRRPAAAGHIAAIDECRERIAAGEIFQANLCLRLEAEWKGDPLDLFARTAGDARAAPRRRGGGTVGRRLQPLARAVPAPPRPRGR